MIIDSNFVDFSNSFWLGYTEKNKWELKIFVESKIVENKLSILIYF